jgi:hypothetical protein
MLHYRKMGKRKNEGKKGKMGKRRILLLTLGE